VPDISKASQFIDQAILTSSAAAFGPSQVARSRLETLRRTSGSNNVLARLEIDGLIDAAGQLIERPTDQGGMARLGWLASEFHTREVLARTEFDSGRYAAAIHRLLDGPVPLVLFDPSLNLQINDSKSLGPVDKLAADVAPDGAVSVWFISKGKRADLASLRGLSPELAAHVAKELSALRNDSWVAEFPLGEQLERAPISPQPSAQPLFRLLGDPQVRLALLKALVYGCAAPLGATIDLTGRCGLV